MPNVSPIEKAYQEERTILFVGTQLYNSFHTSMPLHRSTRVRGYLAQQTANIHKPLCQSRGTRQLHSNSNTIQYLLPDSAWVWRWAGWRGTGLPNPSRETKFSGANADRETSISPFQLTTSRIGNLARLIHTLAICVAMHACSGATNSVDANILNKRVLESYLPLEARWKTSPDSTAKKSTCTSRITAGPAGICGGSNDCDAAR